MRKWLVAERRDLDICCEKIAKQSGSLIYELRVTPHSTTYVSKRFDKKADIWLHPDLKHDNLKKF